MNEIAHIAVSGGLISVALTDYISGLATRQRHLEPASFELRWSAARKSPAGLEETIPARRASSAGEWLAREICDRSL